MKIKLLTVLLTRHTRHARHARPLNDFLRRLQEVEWRGRGKGKWEKDEGKWEKKNERKIE